MALNNEHDLLTCEEAASHLRLHVRTVGRLLNQGKLPGVKVGRQWRLRRADLDAYLAGGTPPQREDAGGPVPGASTETTTAD
jgi:excisionase family DNA binding protein